ncbi:MAG: DUF4325 domain-containing protein [bacterium]|nr:DUF4325 domain-containing protein [bacterium]
MKNVTLDLTTYRTEGARVFTGRDRGKLVRDKSLIDELEKNYDQIKILIPEDIYSINPSFLEEFLFNVVSKLGKDGFYKKFEFSNAGEYEIEEDLESAIERILRKSNALL